ncbi:aromatic-ring hydroxylase C-terminal domain-containing protein, partial [Streptomyces ardesiacus]
VAAEPAAARVYELLTQGRFVLLALTKDPSPGKAVDTDRASRVTAVSVDTYDEHADLDGVTEVLVRPDGHVAWATRTADHATRRDERVQALTAWAGTSSSRS